MTVTAIVVYWYINRSNGNCDFIFILNPKKAHDPKKPQHILYLIGTYLCSKNIHHYDNI